MLLHLDDLLERVPGRGKPAVLLLDEVQELARDRANAPLAAALRTSLDKRTDRLKGVFAGSSREGLMAVFSSRTAPFFHFATPVELPVLGEAFVDHVLGAFEKASRRTLERGEMLSAFDRLHANPYFFRALVETLLHDPSIGVETGLSRLRARIAADLDNPGIWLRLAPLQRAVAQVLAIGACWPFGRTFRESLGAVLDESAPSAGRVQAALRRLERLGLADTHTGEWALADPEFAAWIREVAGTVTRE